MPDLGERILCSEKIFVPPSFPSIMKGYCKAAIRTQPYDLLKWSAAYFRALANGENPPTKDRLEFPHGVNPGLTPGYLKALVNLLGSGEVPRETIEKKWQALCLPPADLETIFSLVSDGNFSRARFLAVAAGLISASLTQTMILVCEAFSSDPEGGKAAIPVDLFLELYEFLAYLECGIMGIGPALPKNQVQAVVEFMRLWSGRQDGMIMPRNIRHWMCPPLDNNSYCTD